MLLRGGAFSSFNTPVGVDSRGNFRFSGVIRPTRAAYKYNQPRRACFVKSMASGPEELSRRTSFANRLGGFTEDGLAYKRMFTVRTYEVGINKTITIQTIASLLQEIFCNQFQIIGYSTDGLATTRSMSKQSLIWVAKRMHIEVYKYLGWSDVLEIESWFHIDAIGMRRDYILRDYTTGEVIGRATIKWVVMNYETRRFQKMYDELRNEIQDYAPKTLRLAFPEENSASVKKIAKLDDLARYNKLRIVPERSDMDMNQYVHHVSYLGWILESIPQKIIDSHELQIISLDFKRESKKDDLIDSLASPEFVANGTNSALHEKDENDCPQFLHLLRLSKDAIEICRARTVWRKKNQIKMRS